MNQPLTPPREVCDALRAANHVALVGHVNPDADVLASLGALWLALPQMGKQAYLVLPEGTVSRRLQYLVRFAGLRPAHAADMQNVDLIVALDTAREKRLNSAEHLTTLTRIPILNIDHHASNPRFGRWNWIVERASSTSELAYELLVALKCQLTPVIATLLYAGIHSDTHGFSLSNTTPRCLAVANELALGGARIVEVCERLMRSHSRGEFELMSAVYRNTRVSQDGLLAWSSLTYDEIQSTGCTAADIDDQVEIPRCIEGIAVALLFSEGEPGRVRINFRGERGVSVLPLAEQFGGGGHAMSAGARMRASLESAVAQVLPAAQQYVAGLGLAGRES